jgi:hypothetical protein
VGPPKLSRRSNPCIAVNNDAARIDNDRLNLAKLLELPHHVDALGAGVDAQLRRGCD